MNQQSPAFDQDVRVMQILALALVMGVIFFGAIVVVIGGLNPPPRGNVVALIGAGFAALMILLHLVVPAMITRNAVNGISEKAEITVFSDIYRTKLLFALALLEGAAFMNLIACFIEHNWWSMAIAGVLLVWMLLQFPTRTRVEQWAENQRMTKNPSSFNHELNQPNE